MHIVIIGAGGVGGYFGGKLSKAGFKTTFIARGKTLTTIKNQGLKVKSILGNFHTYPKVTDDLSIVESADLILLGIKSWQIEDMAHKIKPYLNSKASILPLQNGADNAERIANILPKNQVLAGLCRIVSKIESPGVIDHFSYEPEIVYGEMDNLISDRIQKIKSVFDEAKFKNRISDNVKRDIWIKFLFICSISAAGAMTRSTLGVMREDPFIRGILKQTANEIMAIGQKLNININKTDIDKCFDLIDTLEFNTTMSLQRDMMQGNPSEIDNFNGYIVRQGDQLGIDTPVNDFIYYCLKPMEEKAREKNARRSWVKPSVLRGSEK